MAVQKETKLNRLERILPEGLLVDAAWLEEQGYSRSLRSQYVSAGWLQQPARGVYSRARGTLRWEQVVISLQTILQKPVSVGGGTALQLQGFEHYLSQSPQMIHLYADEKLPGWITKLQVGTYLVTHNRKRLFSPTDVPPELLCLHPKTEHADSELVSLPGGLRLQRWGQWEWPMIVSTPERAILELLDELPNEETFHHVDMIMEGLVNLSPRKLQSLLEDIKSIKVKRLFFFFADRHNHRWLNRIERQKIDLGKGKRMLVKGGKLDSRYNITVPEEFHGVH